MPILIFLSYKVILRLLIAGINCKSSSKYFTNYIFHNYIEINFKSTDFIKELLRNVLSVSMMFKVSKSSKLT